MKRDNADYRQSEPQPQPLTISVDAVAQLTGLSPSMIYHMARTQELPSIKVGRRVLIKRASLERWIDEQERR